MKLAKIENSIETQLNDRWIGQIFVLCFLFHVFV